MSSEEKRVIFTAASAAATAARNATDARQAIKSAARLQAATTNLLKFEYAPSGDGTHLRDVVACLKNCKSWSQQKTVWLRDHENITNHPWLVEELNKEQQQQRYISFIIQHLRWEMVTTWPSGSSSMGKNASVNLLAKILETRSRFPVHTTLDQINKVLESAHRVYKDSGVDPPTSFQPLTVDELGVRVEQLREAQLRRVRERGERGGRRRRSVTRRQRRTTGRRTRAHGRPKRRRVSRRRVAAAAAAGS